MALTHRSAGKAFPLTLSFEWLLVIATRETCNDKKREKNAREPRRGTMRDLTDAGLSHQHHHRTEITQRRCRGAKMGVVAVTHGALEELYPQRAAAAPVGDDRRRVASRQKPRSYAIGGHGPLFLDKQEIDRNSEKRIVVDE